MAAFYMISVVCNTLQGFFRGAGMMKAVLYATYVQIPVPSASPTRSRAASASTRSRRA